MEHKHWSKEREFFFKQWEIHFWLSNLYAAESLQSCLTLSNPIDSSPSGSPVLGFPRQEYWSGLPFPSLICMISSYSIMLLADIWSSIHWATEQQQMWKSCDIWMMYKPFSNLGKKGCFLKYIKYCLIFWILFLIYLMIGCMIWIYYYWRTLSHWFF